MLVPGTRRLCRVGLAAVLVTALCALAFVDLPPQLPEPLSDGPPTLGGEPPGTRSVVAYSWARRLALDYRPSAECPGNQSLSQKEFPIPSPATNWLETLDGRLFLFSAHLDQRVPAYPNVRVIAVRSKPIDDILYCTIWYNKDGWVRSISMEALTADIWLDRWGGISESYTGVLITCPMSRSLLYSPLGVVVSSLPCSEYPSHSIEISNERLRNSINDTRLSFDNEPVKRQFTLCIKGMDFEEDISLKLIAFIELHRILGASKFYFYVFNVHENVLKVLRLFESSNVVRWVNLTLPGNLPNGVKTRRKLFADEIWIKRKMELIPYNHCFYDNLHESEYVLPIDIDEAIIPRRNKNWYQLLNDEKLRLGKSFDDFASYAVRNVYYFNELQPNIINDYKIPGIIRYLDTMRTAFISPEGDSVKSFISTKRALTVHNHYALTTLDAATRRAHHFSPNDVLKHHHRICDARHLNCEMLMQDIVRDKSALHYAHDVITRINYVVKNLTLY